MRSLWDELGETGWAVMRAIADALALDTGFLVDRCRDETLSTLRLLHYPPIAQEELTAASVGIAAHTDFECITLVTQSAAGLELLDRNGAWREAPCGDDVVVVFFGDMLERWTNGVVGATGHRVRPRAAQRYSIVRFFAVDPDVLVEPLAPFVTTDQPARYAPIRQHEHTSAEMDRAQANRDAADTQRI